MAQASLGAGKDVVSRYILLKLSHEVTKEWKFVARYLNLEEGIIDRIVKDNENNTPEQIYQMFLQWIQKEGQDATHKVLKQALEKAQRKDIADKLNTYKEECKSSQRPDGESDFRGDAAYQNEDRQPFSVSPHIQLPRTLHNEDQMRSENCYESTFELNPKPSTRDDLLAISTKIKNGNPSIYLLQFKETLNQKDKIRKCELPKRKFTNFRQEKVIVLLGEKGSGKTTLVNCLINYILGVKWDDNFRFQVPYHEEDSKQRSPTEAQTKWITVYTVHHMEDFQIPYTVTIVDTPGFGDVTAGITNDQTITEQIRMLFSGQREVRIHHVDVIALVTRAFIPRLTVTQMYIYDSILSLLGKDLSPNIFIFATFADGQRPPVMNVLKEGNIPYCKVLKFNNSALYAVNKHHHPNLAGERCSSTSSSEDEDSFDSMFWKMNHISAAAFFQSLHTIENRGLILTKSVLEERSLQTTNITKIQKEIQTGLVKLEQLKCEANNFKRHAVDIEKNQYFTYRVQEDTVVKVALPVGTYTLCCLYCNFVCLSPCTMSDDQKRRCSVIDSGGFCKVCPQHCSWQLHKCTSYKLEIQTKSVTKTSQDLKNRYKAAKSKQLTTGELIKEIIDDFESLQERIVLYTNEVRKSFDRLKEIILKPSPGLTVEYFDTLIETERLQASTGFKDRVSQLYDERRKADILQCLLESGYDPFKEHREMYTSVRKMLGNE